MELAHGKTSRGLASKVKGGSGTRRNVHQSRRKLASHHGRDSDAVPKPLIIGRSLPERARLHHHVGYGGSGTLHLARITTSGRRHRAIIKMTVARLAREALPAIRAGLLTRLCTATRYLRPQLGTCCGDASLVQHDGEPLAPPMPADLADDLSDHLALESGKKQIPKRSVLCQHVSRYSRDRPRRPTQPAEDATLDVLRGHLRTRARFWPTTAVIARRLGRRVAQLARWQEPSTRGCRHDSSAQAAAEQPSEKGRAVTWRAPARFSCAALPSGRASALEQFGIDDRLVAVRHVADLPEV
jgi:hypothetical protein